MNYKKKEKVLKLSDFSSYKKILELHKERSPHTMLVCTNDFPDEWFITILEYKTKSQIVTNESLIIEKDLESWLEWYQKSGWIALTKI